MKEQLKINIVPRLLSLLVAVLCGLWINSSAQAQGQEGMKMVKPPEFLVTSMSKYGFDDTVSMLEGAIAQQNLMVVHEIDGQKMLRMVDVQTKGMKQILFFHPRYMKRIRELNPNGAIEAPLKLLVMERPDGKVMVRYIKPTHLLGQYDGLKDLGKELESVVEKVVATATK